MERYAMYLRKSRADLDAEAHGEGETLARHKKMLYDLAGKMGLTVDDVYEEVAPIVFTSFAIVSPPSYRPAGAGNES